MFNKILIANRGEIAVRIIRACKEMGITSVAIFSDADRHALHVKKADESYFVGDDPLKGYLNAHRIVNIAVTARCDAIHPGYGFLSENPELAAICAKRGIKFIGPESSIIHKMGDKIQARKAMVEAGVPVTPGSDGNINNQETKATFLSVWDTKNQESLRIDLWTKDMPLDEMKLFFYQTLLSMSTTFKRATSDEKMSQTMVDFCDYFAEKLELKK